MRSTLFILAFLGLSFCVQVSQAAKTISGAVYDQSKQPLVGVSVSEKGSGTGVLTDLRGIIP